MSIFWSWLILTLAFWLSARVLPGFELQGAWNTIKIAALFGVLNWAIGWLIFFILGVGTLGIGFLLAAVTRWIATAIVLKLTDALSQSLKIQSFVHALLAALVISVTGTVGEFLITRVT